MRFNYVELSRLMDHSLCVRLKCIWWHIHKCHIVVSIIINHPSLGFCFSFLLSSWYLLLFIHLYTSWTESEIFFVFFVWDFFSFSSLLNKGKTPFRSFLTLVTFTFICSAYLNKKSVFEKYFFVFFREICNYQLLWDLSVIDIKTVICFNMLR
jgi:hypothetical protein